MTTAIQTDTPINVFDNFLSLQDCQSVLRYCYEASYTYGERDRPETPPTGMVHVIDNESEIYQLFHDKTRELVPHTSKLYRMYVNCFAPNENPYFHIDGSHGITFLYYPDQKWELDQGGETQFYINGEIHGITPVSNRIVMFDANIMHRATTFRNGYRFTLAVKYKL